MSVQLYCKVMGKGSYVQSCYCFLYLYTTVTVFVYLYTLFYLHKHCIKRKHILNQNKTKGKISGKGEKKGKILGGKKKK